MGGATHTHHPKNRIKNAPRPRHHHLPDVGDEEPPGVALLLVRELQVGVRLGHGGERVVVTGVLAWGLVKGLLELLPLLGEPPRDEGARAAGGWWGVGWWG